MNDLVPEDPKDIALESQQRREITRHKNRAIIPALASLADEVDERARSGKLAEELKSLKVSSLLGNLTRIIAAIKDNAPQVLINNGATNPDPVWLRANSSANISPKEREARKNKILEAEVVKETPNGKVDSEAGPKEGSPKKQSREGGEAS